MHAYTDDELAEVIRFLIEQESETEWLEFKVDNTDPERIGRYISGLANSAALTNRNTAYLVWGVTDDDHRIVGTSFAPQKARHKQQELLFWLNGAIDQTSFSFSQIEIDGATVVVLEVDPAVGRPATFRGTPYVRIGSSLAELRSDPQRETRLWEILRNATYEDSVALESVTEDQIPALLDLAVFDGAVGNSLSTQLEDWLESAAKLGFLRKRDDSKWDVTNLGALLFSRNLSDFPSTDGKEVRVVVYAGTDRSTVVRRQEGRLGYGSGFQGLLRWLQLVLPAREVYIEGQRHVEQTYSDLLLREALANALIHQDLTIRGSGPRIEVFSDRVEITNPGAPLIAADRVLNHPAVSRNPALGRRMRDLGLCEEHGTGWDRMAMETEVAGLPSPRIEVHEQATRVTLFGPRKLTKMERRDQLWAVYMHACLQWAKTEHLTNASLRERFDVSSSNSAQVSRLLSAALEAGYIRVFDASVGSRAKSYVPYWV